MPQNMPVTLLALLVGLTGCEPLDMTQFLTVTITDPADIDVVCDDGGCDTPDTLAVTVSWNATMPAVEDQQMYIHQYRVDYDIADFAGQEIPFFAGLSDVSFGQDEDVGFSITPIGNTQRGVLGSDTRAGTARVTFAGWDQYDNLIVFPADGAEFTINLDNFTTATSTTSSTTSTGI
jgi:hypothetical protein